ncbi:MAG: hypothetical protein WCO78_04870 [Candidatus Roizmanbacteria bacterium]
MSETPETPEQYRSGIKPFAAVRYDRNTSSMDGGRTLKLGSKQGPYGTEFAAEEALEYDKIAKKAIPPPEGVKVYDFGEHPPTVATVSAGEQSIPDRLHKKVNEQLDTNAPLLQIKVTDALTGKETTIPFTLKEFCSMYKQTFSIKFVDNQPCLCIDPSQISGQTDISKKGLVLAFPKDSNAVDGSYQSSDGVSQFIKKMTRLVTGQVTMSGVDDLLAKMEAECTTGIYKDLPEVAKAFLQLTVVQRALVISQSAFKVSNQNSAQPQKESAKVLSELFPKRSILNKNPKMNDENNAQVGFLTGYYPNANRWIPARAGLPEKKLR